MKRLLCLTFASCTLAVPAFANLPVETSAFATSPAPVLSDELVVAAAPALGALRAGQLASPASLAASERDALRAASERAPQLGELRAGVDGPSDNEWTWIGIGAAVVLLIVLL